ncbi:MULTISPECIES: DUF4265 domain-containing protein [unclassified Streptomyces]|uniref:DUF4265 domain-containing protein n=1 Tax=unclassified Streptomyces TaxID=2593676 RepID=UPI00093E5A1B|nr:DUF4265 domain-containing protein [Streptomyces sp. CB02400]OKK07221.1 hypothetical protein AMK33_20005 [Streptomyces sp. CB02400]
MTNPEGPYVKVHFRLEIEDDRPPASVESLWAVDQGDGTVRLDNIPWFVRDIACGDIVATEPDEEGVRWAGEVVRRSGNCTIRLIVFRDGGSEAARQSVIDAFHGLGVHGDGMERFRMVALDVPPAADLAKVQRLLRHGVAEEWWDMEEGCVTARWRAVSAG